MAACATMVVHSHELGWAAICEALRRIPVEIVGQATSRTQAIRLASVYKPDLIVASAILENQSSAELLSELRHTHIPSAKLVIFTHSDIGLDDLMGIGHLQPNGFLTWRETANPEYAYCALKLALSGNFVIGSLSLSEAFLSALRGQSAADQSKLQLTDREHRILSARARGITYDEIARCEGISPRTVVRNFKVLRNKLGAPDNGTLLMKATMRGLLP